MIKTEMRNEATRHIDQMTTAQMLQAISVENFNASLAVEKALPQIAEAVDAITVAFEKGGRLFYIGAGTSGRLGVLDASECPPTYGVPYEQVQGIIAGGEACMFRASENAEDNEAQGAKDIAEREINEKDVVVGISVAGGASYVVGALTETKRRGGVAIALTCNENTPIEKVSDICIVTDTGAEAITGSTRMKAGTAHKMVLNMLSTCSMVKTGKVYENLMINLRPSNIKLKNRMVRIVGDIMSCDEAQAVALLEKHGWNIRAIVDAEK
jgi:N-acetylmuramic acid 6-phosphate etherase